MGRLDWLRVGLKLLGVYFGVSGVASVWNTLLVLLFAANHGMHMDNGIGAIGILQPAVYLLAAFLLVCQTRTCLRWCGEPERDPSAHPDADRPSY